MIIIGEIFCKVEMTQHISHEEESITDGSQKWAGASPSFNMKLRINVKLVSMEDGSFKRKIERSSTIDANACVRK